MPPLPLTSPHYERLLALQSAGITLGLDRIQAVLKHLGHPERQASTTLIIAGTNGKGSAASTLSAAMSISSRKVGLFTSPHLVRPTERIRIDDRTVSWDQFDDAAEVVLRAIHETSTPLSFFEAMTAMAFVLFERNGVEVQILEVGLGGRRDATRAATPTHTLVMGVARDHTRILGGTLAQIAREKLGACSSGSENVFGLPPRLRHMCPAGWHLGADVQWRSLSAGGVRVMTPLRAVRLPAVRLIGGHQRRNLALATAMGIRLGLTDEELAYGAANVQWPARMQRLFNTPATWLDGAHNPAAVARLIAMLPEVGLQPGYSLVFGAHPKKDARPMLCRLAEQAGHIWLTSADKLVSADSLQPHLRNRVNVHVVADAGAAMVAARAHGVPVLIAGSLYLAGAILKYVESVDIQD